MEKINLVEVDDNEIRMAVLAYVSQHVCDLTGRTPHVLLFTDGTRIHAEVRYKDDN